MTTHQTPRKGPEGTEGESKRKGPENARGEPDTQEQARRDAEIESLEGNLTEFDIINATTGVIIARVAGADDANALDRFARMNGHPNYEKSLYVTDDPLYAREADDSNPEESAASRVTNHTKDSERDPNKAPRRDGLGAYNKEVNSVAEDQKESKDKPKR
jgi:hypothetical protein